MSTPGPPASSEQSTLDEHEIRTVVWRLETELKNARSYGAKVNRQLHRVMMEDLRKAEQRALRAERRAARAVERAETAERQLAELRAAHGTPASRAFRAVASRIKRPRQS